MIKLIVVMMLASTSSDGGTSIYVHESNFGSMQACERAKAWFEGQASAMSDVRYDRTAPRSKALYISGTCVQQ